MKQDKAIGVLAGLLVVLFLTGCGQSAALNVSTANVKHIAQGEFADEVTHSALPVVVDFYAPWCGPCRKLGPLLDRVAGGYTNRVKFVKVNVDEAPKLAQDFQVEAIPTVIFFKGGKVAERMVGVPDEAELRIKLEALALAK